MGESNFVTIIHKGDGQLASTVLQVKVNILNAFPAYELRAEKTGGRAI